MLLSAIDVRAVLVVAVPQSTNTLLSGRSGSARLRLEHGLHVGKRRLEGPGVLAGRSRRFARDGPGARRTHTAHADAIAIAIAATPMRWLEPAALRPPA